MKKNILKVISLVLVVGMLFAFTSCTQEVLVRFVDQDGNDLDLSGLLGGVSAGNTSTDTPATDAPTAAPSGDSTTAAPAGDSTTAAPAGDSTTAAPAGDSTTAAPAPSEPAQSTGNKMPSTKDEIMNFYKAATEKVTNGEAGYTKKEWQAVGDLNITGVAVADNAIKNIIGGIMTEESAAEDQVSEKGSDQAKSRWGAKCTLTDYSWIKSATCEQVGSNYKIVIVTEKDDTPHKTGSTIEKITQSVLWWEDVEAELVKQSKLLKSYDGVHLMYNSVTINAEITPDGQFVSMDMYANVDIIIGSATIIIATIKDKQAHLDNYVKYTNFNY